MFIFTPKWSVLVVKWGIKWSCFRVSLRDLGKINGKFGEIIVKNIG